MTLPAACTHARTLASAQLDQRVNTQELEALRAHLALCPACHAAAANYAMQRLLLRAAPQMAAPQGLAQRICAQMVPQRSAWQRMRGLRIAASVLLLAALTTLLLQEPEPAPALEAAAAPAMRAEALDAALVEASVTAAPNAEQITQDPGEVIFRSNAILFLQQRALKELPELALGLAHDADEDAQQSERGVSAAEVARGVLSCGSTSAAVQQLIDDVAAPAPIEVAVATKSEQGAFSDAKRRSKDAVVTVERRIYTVSGPKSSDAVHALLVRSSKTPVQALDLAQGAAARRGALEWAANRAVVRDRVEQRYTLFLVGRDALADLLIGQIESLPGLVLRAAEGNPDTGDTVLIALDQ